jgi:hypothetical protein
MLRRRGPTADLRSPDAAAAAEASEEVAAALAHALRERSFVIGVFTATDTWRQAPSLGRFVPVHASLGMGLLQRRAVSGPPLGAEATARVLQALGAAYAAAVPPSPRAATVTCADWALLAAASAALLLLLLLRWLVAPRPELEAGLLALQGAVAAAVRWAGRAGGGAGAAAAWLATTALAAIACVLLLLGVLVGPCALVHSQCVAPQQAAGTPALRAGLAAAARAAAAAGTAPPGTRVRLGRMPDGVAPAGAAVEAPTMGCVESNPVYVRLEVLDEGWDALPPPLPSHLFSERLAAHLR